MKTRTTTSNQRQPRVLVLGGNGFVGRYTVTELLRRKAAVVIGTRKATVTNRSRFGVLAPRFRQVRIQNMLDPVLWVEPLAGIDVVINAVGILRERGDETFAAVHHQGVAALATACRKLNVPLIHVSALGIDQSVENEFSLSKLRGEQAIANSGCRASIVRASVVDALDGYGSGWFHRVAQWPFRLLPGGADKRISPVAAADLGEALGRLALSEFLNPAKVNQTDLHSVAVYASDTCKLYEVGCGENFSLAEYLQRIRCGAVWGRKRPWVTLRVPARLARLAALTFDQFNLTPYSIGHHELLENDNIPKLNALPLILGRAPRPIVAASTMKEMQGVLLANNKIPYRVVADASAN